MTIKLLSTGAYFVTTDVIMSDHRPQQGACRLHDGAVLRSYGLRPDHFRVNLGPVSYLAVLALKVGETFSAKPL